MVGWCRGVMVGRERNLGVGCWVLLVVVGCWWLLVIVDS